MLPNRLTKIDETSCSVHTYLSPDDGCYYFGEFFAGKGFRGGETNQLVLNFKIKPSQIALNPRRSIYKVRAIQEIASALRSTIGPADVNRITFVPVPGSKVRGHADYCQRLEMCLQVAFDGLNPDIRPLLRQTQSTDPDHEAGQRLTIDELRALIEIDHGSAANPFREWVMLFDDVITSGKHFKVCREKILAFRPAAQVAGIFVARRIPTSPFEAILEF